MLSTKLKEAAGNSADATLYVDDVFSTYLYTGNGSTQTITNGIDLAGKGGLVWQKSRSAATAHVLSDTLQGVGLFLESDSTGAQTSNLNSITAFNSNGFAFGSLAKSNTNLSTYVSWTFREAAKFFDVVTYTGNGTNNRAIAHSLGCEVGMIIVKKTSGVGQWATWSRGFNSGNGYAYLNLTNGFNTNGGVFWGSYGAYVAPTSTSFTVSSDADVNGSGQTYVAYLFAHDTSSTGIIQCGSFTTDASGNATVNLGWEPQYIMWKRSDSTGSWYIQDTARDDLKVDFGGKELTANTNDAESNSSSVGVTATGFVGLPGYTLTSSTCIYVAIRMPNKPPTSGTQVYTPIARTGTGTAATVTGAGFAPDLVIGECRSQANGSTLKDRLRGVSPYNYSFTSTAEGSENTAITSFNMDGISVGTDSVTGCFNLSSQTYVNQFFKRAPGFFDEVCYTGTGTATTQAHNLTVVPELMIVKERSAANDWWVYVSSVGNTKYSVLNSTAASVTSSTAWNNTTPTASVFSIGTGANVNASTQTYVAYLFATLAGISKVGSYTGNGTGQVIACGFSAGARFVLIKRTDSTGDWYIFDSARGLTSGSSPYLLLNTPPAAEVTGNNGVYASTGGFTLGSTASTTTNINAATYIFLAVA